MSSLEYLETLHDDPKNMHGMDIDALEAKTVADAEYIRKESSFNGVKLIIEFPIKSDDGPGIKREVNSIMRNALMEQIKFI